MAQIPWRFQADIPLGVTDPDVTVFVGDTYTEDSTGNSVVYQDTSNPVTMKLSELAAFIANPELPEHHQGGAGPFVRPPAPPTDEGATTT